MKFIKYFKKYITFLNNYRIISNNLKTNIMKTFIFFYNGRVITKAEFLKKVPENWENEVENGLYSWGYYNAVEL